MLHWHDLVERLNRAERPSSSGRCCAIARDGYGWTEYIEHAGCADAEGCKRFFRRAGAWLALFHCFAGSDMHQENMIAAGEHPVPIDLETILQAAGGGARSPEAEAQAFEAATEIIANSVMAVGLLPAYGRICRRRYLCHRRSGLGLDIRTKLSRGTTSIPTRCGLRR